MEHKSDENRRRDKQLLITGVGAAGLFTLSYLLPHNSEFVPHAKEDIGGHLQTFGQILLFVGAWLLGWLLAFMFTGLLALRLGDWLYRRYRAWQEEYNRFD
ncbi:hypothetical protein [Hymenobacter koreensis]|uniref:Uncharacterized protein n=1 Tax=Hymenobacter koreensis TaxID=1084523 RepID=A0ABP8IWG3_9BACT